MNRAAFSFKPSLVVARPDPRFGCACVGLSILIDPLAAQKRETKRKPWPFRKKKAHPCAMLEDLHLFLSRSQWPLHTLPVSPATRWASFLLSPHEERGCGFVPT